MGITFFKSYKENVTTRGSAWSTQDVADFYRAVDILRQAGMKTDVDSGVTDEGDPWFVFVRPETGDVIAHFAKIEGSFIAVSSLNQEVYKGKDVRDIVDKMLIEHPILLPRGRDGTRLLIHPTAAISAFLAAAFILTVDGVKATSIEQVISEASSQNASKEENGWGILQLLLKSDPLKGIISEGNFTNYNVAVLGAALIPHDSYSKNSFHDTWPDFKEQIITRSRQEVVSEKSENPEHQVSMSAMERVNFDNAVAEYFFKSLKQNLDTMSLKGEHLVEGGIEKEFFDSKSNQTIQKSEGDGQVVGSGAEMVWVGHKPFIFDNYGVQSKSSQVNRDSDYKANERPISENSDPEAGHIVLGKLDPILSEYMLELDPLENIASADLDGLGVTLVANGDLKAVTFESRVEEDVMAFVKANSKDVPAPLNAFSAPILLDEYLREDNLTVSAEPELLSASPVEAAPSKVPILGHSFHNPDRLIELTSALDVVFYQGGDAEISGFELGKDLLWFLLSPEELANAKNTVDANGDLVIDFGHSGTLTFLGVVEGAMFEVVV